MKTALVGYDFFERVQIHCQFIFVIEIKFMNY